MNNQRFHKRGLSYDQKDKRSYNNNQNNYYSKKDDVIQYNVGSNKEELKEKYLYNNYNKGFIGHDIYENYEENKQRKRYGNSYEHKPKNSELLYQNPNKILNENKKRVNNNNNERINIDYTNAGYKKRLNKMQDNMRNNHPQRGKNQIRTGDHQQDILYDKHSKNLYNNEDYLSEKDINNIKKIQNTNNIPQSSSSYINNNNDYRYKGNIYSKEVENIIHSNDKSLEDLNFHNIQYRNMDSNKMKLEKIQNNNFNNHKVNNYINQRKKDNYILNDTVRNIKRIYDGENQNNSIELFNKNNIKNNPVVLKNLEQMKDKNQGNIMKNIANNENIDKNRNENQNLG